MNRRLILGDEAKALSFQDKWALLSPHLKQHGREALSYSTLQQGMEYFLTDLGYIAFVTVRHPVFAPRSKAIVLCDPVCAPLDRRALIQEFLEARPRAAFGVISESCAETLRALAFKANCIGYEPVLPVQSYNTRGNWKELDLIKRSRNEARREGIAIREQQIDTINRNELQSVTRRWMETKKVNDREIWIYARHPVFEHEQDVRKFVAYDREDRVVGYAFYDPIYSRGLVIGYSATISRCDEHRYGRLATAIHMEAMEAFRTEGKHVLNLCLAPFVKLELGKYNDDKATRWFFEFSAKYGNDIYNFQGLSFHKSKYRGAESPIYFASNCRFPSNDVYLAFRSADISRGYFSTLFQLVRGLVKGVRPPRNGLPEADALQSPAANTCLKQCNS
jgi:lysylphosphatidylglycerol synthetase-like protein (DUF2156 family)